MFFVIFLDCGRDIFALFNFLSSVYVIFYVDPWSFDAINRWHRLAIHFADLTPVGFSLLRYLKLKFHASNPRAIVGLKASIRAEMIAMLLKMFVKMVENAEKRVHCVAVPNKCDKLIDVFKK